MLTQSVNQLISDKAVSQLAMRSLRPEHFFTSEKVLRTWGPTKTVAKCVPYRSSIQYLFMLSGANKIDYILCMPIETNISLLTIFSFWLLEL